MELDLASACLQEFEKALKEPLGNVILPFLDTRGSGPYAFKLAQLRTGLFKNKFKSPSEFVEKFIDTIDEFTVLIGPDTENGICFGAFKNLVLNRFQKFLKGDSLEYGKNVDILLSGIQQVIDFVPDSKAEFEEIVKKKDTPHLPPPMATRDSSNKHNEYKKGHHEEFNYVEMKNAIRDMLYDEDVTEAVTIVTRYEPSVKPNADAIVEFDLFKCNPYTLRLLMDVINKAPKSAYPLPEDQYVTETRKEKEDDKSYVPYD